MAKIRIQVHDKEVHLYQRANHNVSDEEMEAILDALRFRGHRAKIANLPDVRELTVGRLKVAFTYHPRLIYIVEIDTDRGQPKSSLTDSAERFLDLYNKIMGR